MSTSLAGRGRRSRASGGRGATLPPGPGGNGRVGTAVAAGRPLATRVVVCEAAVALAVLAAARSALALAVAAPVALLLVVLTLGRRRGRWLSDHLRVAARFRRRATGRAAVTAREPRLAPLGTLLPGVRVEEARDRSGERVGLAVDPGGWAAVLSLEPAGPVVAGQPGPVTVEDLAAVFEDPEQRVASVQALTLSVPAPSARLPVADDPTAFSYAELLGTVASDDHPRPPAHRSSWVALRLDPAGCPDAVARRGGGPEGARRALLGVAARLAAALDTPAAPARVLDAPGLLEAVLEAGGATEAASASATASGAEHWDRWERAGAAHTSWAVRRWRAGGAGLDAVTAPHASTLCTSLLLGRDARGAVTAQALVRVTAPPGHLDAARAEVEQSARAAGLGLLRLDGEQAAGVVASLPLAGLGQR
ncbi:type VII secretion protein EccE [Motilibacter aurantiacus]|uniref:type VII secretion protein EccE n=1 Tax=Motilibacter aurantiacus TaxID=2714955 RepID=UPI00140AC46A|nr:type VII secretion protein EccE [Motilibacter aurantiacus]NHC44044.1 type VII secretion protein EccE [Motilibacter aurantiacus]